MIAGRFVERPFDETHKSKSLPEAEPDTVKNASNPLDK